MVNENKRKDHSLATEEQIRSFEFKSTNNRVFKGETHKKSNRKRTQIFKVADKIVLVWYPPPCGERQT